MIVGNARVGRYALELHVASGGMSEVYRALDPQSGRVVALKVPHDGDDVWEAEEAGARLQMALSQLDPRVPRVYEIGDSDERFVAMEYVDGEDLSRRLKRGALDWREAVRIAIELCGMLGTAHSASVSMDGETGGIVHGDIKPRNVRLQDCGSIKVLDFGIAKALRQARAETRNLYGSVAYSSPERLDRGRVDYQSDLWSVAVVLFEMVDGRPPFRAASEDELERLIRGGARPAPLEHDLPRPLARVVEKALAPRLEDRYASAPALEEDLRAVLEGIPTLAEWEDALRSIEPGPPPADPHATQNTESGPPSDLDATRRTQSDAMPDSDGVGDATRRTLPGATFALDGVGDATRRTIGNGAAASLPPIPIGGAAGTSAASFSPASSASLSTAPLGSAGSANPAPRGGWTRFVWIPWKPILVVLLVVFIANEMYALNSAGELRSSLPARPIGDARAVWAQYQRLAKRSLLMGVTGLGNAVKEWLVGHADDAIEGYRMDLPSIFENDWRTSRALLERASSIDPNDRRVRARLEYVRGQLQRIEARGSKTRDQGRRKWDESLRSFERSARLWPRWPDPLLGMAQVYAYSKKDPERAAQALERAKDAGYTLGERESAVMGDAYRLRAERRWATGVEAADQDQQYRYLERIRDDCVEALAQYEAAPDFADVPRNTRAVRARLAEVERRMSALTGESLLFGQ